MDPWTVAHTELALDLTRVVRTRLIDPIDILLGAGERLEAQLQMQAQEWACALLGEDETAATLTAARLIGALYPSDEPFQPPATWWATPFGRAVLLRVGHPYAQHVTVAVAAAMLGISRQGVHDLAGRGRLERTTNGEITVASIRARLTARTAARAPGTQKHERK